MTYGGFGIQIDNSVFAVGTCQIYVFSIISAQAKVGCIGVGQSTSSVYVMSNRNRAGIICLTYINGHIASYITLHSASIYII